MIFSFGMSLALRSTKGCRYAAVLSSMAGDIHGWMGTRLTGFKAWACDPSIKLTNWKFGVYELKWTSSGSLESIKHMNGDVAATPPWASHVNRRWALQADW